MKIIFSSAARWPRLALGGFIVGGLATPACSSSSSPVTAQDSGTPAHDASITRPDVSDFDASKSHATDATDATDALTRRADAADASVHEGDAADAGVRKSDAADADASSVYIETALTLELLLGKTVVDGGVDASKSADGGAATRATLTITARDGVTPVITDLWLYTLDGSGEMTPLTGFTSNAARKTPRLMLPAMIAGKPSGLAPADNGDLNGVMTNTTRGVLEQGAFVSTINGTVIVTLPSAPTTPILVVAGVEDERYAGAAAINPDGTTGTVPSGVGLPATHTRVSFTKDVEPILQTNCIGCHTPTGPDNAGFYLVTGTRDDLVNDNFALKEQTLVCQEADPDGGPELAACIQAITKAQYLIEPGAPAVSDLLQRARPDEDAGTSTLGLAWYGSKGNRYNTSYGDRRMPSTTQSTTPADWTNASAYFDLFPAEYQVIYDWVAQGALP